MKHKEGDVVRKGDGLLYERTRTGWRRYWTSQMIDELQKLYPNTPNDELAGILGVTKVMLEKKAAEFGLHKTRQYLASVSRHHLVFARAAGAVYGNPGQFKPGQNSHEPK